MVCTPTLTDSVVGTDCTGISTEAGGREGMDLAAVVLSLFRGLIEGKSPRLMSVGVAGRGESSSRAGHASGVGL